MKNPIRMTVSTFGAVMALAGIEHGAGEILQGNSAPAGLMFPSWPKSAFFQNLGGEPAMSLIPDLLLTGILTVLVSSVLLVWVVWFVGRRRGGLVTILLSAAMLLVGGGIFPPLLAMLLGVLALRIHSPLLWWRRHLSPGILHLLAAAWPWLYAVCILAWLCLSPGIGLLGIYFGLDSLELILVVISLVLVSLLLTVISAFGSTALRVEKGVRAA